MAILGGHMSIAGGYYKAVEQASQVGADCVQIFTKNNNQWRAKPITDDDIDKFQNALKSLNITHPLSHASYLINLASPNPQLYQKSTLAMTTELQRADQLGIPHVVLHPGSFTTSSEQSGLDRVAAAIDQIFANHPSIQANILLETTAGQGTNLGWKFAHLKKIIRASEFPKRLGVCLDTCHVFAAGYPLADNPDYQRTIDRLINAVGIRRIKAIHLNDSQKPLGSRRDRHEHIGRGALGLQPFRNLLNDRRFNNTPMYLETAKGEEHGEDLDAINLRTLRDLIDY